MMKFGRISMDWGRISFVYSRINTLCWLLTWERDLPAGLVQDYGGNLFYTFHNHLSKILPPRDPRMAIFGNGFYLFPSFFFLLKYFRSCFYGISLKLVEAQREASVDSIGILLHSLLDALEH